jgi:hypothetical protein
MNRPFAHKSKEELEAIRDATSLGLDGKPRTITNYATVDQVEAVAELEHRELQSNIQKLTKPHWSLTPTFWLVLISTLAVLFQVWQSCSPNNKPASATVPMSSEVQGLKPTEAQQKRVSPPPSSQVMNKNSSVTKKSDDKSK